MALLFCALSAPCAGTAHAASLAQHFVAVAPTVLPNIAFEDERGETVNLQGFRGRYILLNLWATWCAPCVKELPSLDTLQTQFTMRRLMIIALAEDSNGLSAARAYYVQHGIKHLALYADGAGRVPSILRARGLPTSYLIDPEGMEIGRVEGGADWGAPDAVTFLESKMKAPGLTAPSY